MKSIFILGAATILLTGCIFNFDANMLKAIEKQDMTIKQQEETIKQQKEALDKCNDVLKSFQSSR
jgi:hypothetical protein